MNAAERLAARAAEAGVKLELDDYDPQGDDEAERPVLNALQRLHQELVERDRRR